MADTTDKNRELAEWVFRRLNDAAIHGWVPEGMYVEVANRIAQREAEIRAEYAIGPELRKYLIRYLAGQRNAVQFNSDRGTVPVEVLNRLGDAVRQTERLLGLQPGEAADA